MELLTNIYLGCFIFGLVFTVATFLLGGIGHLGAQLGHTPTVHTTHLHVGDHSSPATSPQHAGSVQNGNGQLVANTDQNSHVVHSHSFPIFNYLNFSALVVFITWFGAAGFVVSAMGLDGVWSLLPAIVVGVLGYLAVLLFLLKVLLPSDMAPLSAADDDLHGTVARVSSPIFERGVGEVIYLKNGARRSAPARSLDGRPFPKDSKVVILKYESGIVFVDDLDRLLADAGAEKWTISPVENQQIKS